MAYKLCDAPLQGKSRGCRNPVRGNWRCRTHGGPSKALVDEYFKLIQYLNIASDDSAETFDGDLAFDLTSLSEYLSETKNQKNPNLPQGTARLQEQRALQLNLDELTERGKAVARDNRLLRQKISNVTQDNNVILVRFATLRSENIRLNRELDISIEACSKERDDYKYLKDNASIHNQHKQTKKKSHDRVTKSWKEKAKNKTKSSIAMITTIVSKPENVDFFSGHCRYSRNCL